MLTRCIHIISTRIYILLYTYINLRTTMHPSCRHLLYHPNLLLFRPVLVFFIRVIWPVIIIFIITFI